MTYKCPFCGKTEPTINWLRIHIRKCHDDEDLVCPACGFKSKRLVGLIYHCGVRNDRMHQALYYLLHRNTRTHYVKTPTPIRTLKDLKEVFKA